MKMIRKFTKRAHDGPAREGEGVATRVWVLIRRYEWEDQSQQTEYCDTFVFETKRDAVDKAASLLRGDMRRHGECGVEAWKRAAVDLRVTLYDNRVSPRHLVQLTDGDNVVFELYQRKVNERRKRK